MKRKLVKQANQAFTITLPISWVRENRLKAGDDIDLEISEKNIIIRTDKRSMGGKVVLDLEKFDRRKSITYINSCYAKGIDELELKTGLDVYKIISQNMGYAVVEERQGKHMIKDVSGQANALPEEMFKQVLQMLLTFYEAALKDVFQEHKADEETVASMDREINKYTFFLQRQIMKHAYEDQAVGRIMFAYSFWLEHLGDLISRLWRAQIMNKIKLSNIDEEICNLGMKSLQALFQAAYQFSDDKIDVLITTKIEARKKIAKTAKASPAKGMFLNYALKIAEDCADVVQLVLMLKIKEE